MEKENSQEKETTLVLHGQDWPPGGGAAHGARATDTGRLPLRRATVRLGGAGHVGTRAERRGVGIPDLLPGPWRPWGLPPRSARSSSWRS
jgi:hypothetical protein